MTTIILPGSSLKNRAWAQDLKNSLLPEIDAKILNWADWDQNQDAHIDLNLEAPKTLSLIPEGPYTILAKSIGTYLLMHLFEKLDQRPEKIILCGLPLHDLNTDELKAYTALKSFPPEKLVCFQNDSDPHGSFIEAKTFLESINSSFPVISMPGTTHDYPYSEDFKKFLLP